MDYKTTTGSVYLSGNVYPSDRLTLSVSGTYTIAKGEFDPLELALPEEILEHGDYDFSEVHAYSDLEYNLLEVSGRGTLMFTERASLYAGGTYYGLADEKPYAYGDLDGSVLLVETGIQVGF